VVRLVFFTTFSLLLLFVDARFRALESTRSALSVILSPIHQLATFPGMLWQGITNIYITQGEQHKLIKEIDDLRLQHENDAAQLSQFQALQAENQQLRKLADLTMPSGFTRQIAEIIYTERDVFQRKVIIDKGADSNIQLGQVVMDDAGIVGQITRVYPMLSEVTLITERDHAVPVEVLRNNLRTILFGSGDTSQLSLRYMPVGADIQNDDVLVTSGIDGTYPPGIPVARIISIERDPAFPFARVTCLPIGGVDKHRHLLILSNLKELPKRPAGNTSPIIEKQTRIKRKS